MQRHWVEFLIIAVISFAVGILVSPLPVGFDRWTIDNIEKAAIVATPVLAIVALVVSLRAAIAAIRANSLAQQTLIGDLRPWLSVVVDSVSGISWSGRKALVNVEVTLRNHGKSPALRVVPKCMLYVMNSSENAVDSFRKFCSRSLKPDYETVGNDIFPGSTIASTYALVADEAQVEMGRSGYSESYVSSRPIVLCVFVVVQYRSVYEEKRYQTGYICTLVKHDGNGSSRRTYLAVGEDIRADLILLERSIVDAGQVS